MRYAVIALTIAAALGLMVLIGGAIMMMGGS
jgi:hypothetical protein